MTRASCVRVGPPLFALSVDRFFYVKVVPSSGGHEALQRDEAERVAKVVEDDDVGIVTSDNQDENAATIKVRMRE